MAKDDAPLGGCMPRSPMMLGLMVAMALMFRKTEEIRQNRKESK
jgi:hypothetical protein